jgi:ubiquinone/menaquinone biosynthesis C-methylase UbiE
MERVLEPELMDHAQRAQAYARADFATSNQMFVNRLLSDFPGLAGDVVDLGCGPADVMIRLARAKPDLRITAVDGSEPMIQIARSALQVHRLEPAVKLLCARLPGLPLPDGKFDAVLSKDLLHHLPDPSVLWSEARRLGGHRAVISVMDLFRPDTLGDVKRLVQEVTGKEDAFVQEDFFNSLCAAFTPDEVEEQLKAAGLKLAVERVSERHMLVHGRLS